MIYEESNRNGEDTVWGFFGCGVSISNQMHWDNIMGRALEKIEREPYILFFFFFLGERKVRNFIDELNPI